MSTRDTSQLHIFFFPYMAHGRAIPALDIANMFASRGFKITIILTPVNASIFAKAIERSRNLGFQIQVLIIKFPAEEFGLPPGCEIARLATTNEMLMKFVQATALLEHPVEQLIAEHHPDCLVSDTLFTWTNRVAAKFGIPRLEFDGTNFFALCTSISLRKYQPQMKVSSESEPFVVPNLPHEIKLTRDQLAFYVKEENPEVSAREKAKESELESDGIIINSFYELEPDYADHYRKVMGKKAWHIGPTCLFYKDLEGKAQRGEESSIDKHECLTWLDSKKANSVVYISFGSVVNFSDAQLMEIALGLDACGKQFIWVVRKDNKNESGALKEEWLPEGFEKRIEGKGLIIRGWAPQVAILEHEAVGAFVTHCGWNSVLEAICAGVPLVAWPVMSDQFYNEKYVVQILGIGVSVGAKKWARFVGDSVKSEALEKALNQILEGEEAEKMRTKVKVLKEKASKAFEEGGSSYSDFNSLIEELKLRRTA